MAAHHRLLGIALAPVRHALALAHHHDALDHLLDHPLGQCARARRRRLLDEGFDQVVVLLVVGDELGGERLRQFRAVAVERIGFERELPGEEIRRLAVGDGRIVGHVDGFRNRPRNERLRCRHHADVALDREIAPAVAPAGIGAIEHRVVLGLEVRGAFDRHGAADMHVGGVDLAPAEAECGEKIKPGIGKLLGRNAERGHELLAQRPFVECELDVEGGRQRLLDLLDRFGSEPLLGERRMIDRRRLGEAAVTDRIDLDVGDLFR